MDELQLLADLYKAIPRQGPGGDAETENALNLAAIDRNAPLKTADIGCGTGASTLILARLLNARITAVDFLQEFLDVLESKAEIQRVSNKVTPLCCPMESLPFSEQEFDIIWSEGAIYNIGFKKGISDWHEYLKPNGLLVVSEITWMTNTRPVTIQNHWENEYPEIDVASSKMSILEQNGYSPIGYFVLPEHCWVENFYRPLQDSFTDFLKRNGHSPEARAIVEAENKEIELYEKYKSYYSYGVYIARKLD